MVIQKLGGYCFKLSAGPVTIALNPPSEKSRTKIAKFGAHVAVISMLDPDWNGPETASHGEKEPFVIRGPGAYEVGDVRITGHATPSSYNDCISEIGNTVYVIEMDGIRVLSLGGISDAKLSSEVRSEIDNIGIVLVPVGEQSLDPKAAHELVTALEPNVVIPYAVSDEKSLAAFLKTEGATGATVEEKFTVRAKELATMDGAVIMLA